MLNSFIDDRLIGIEVRNKKNKRCRPLEILSLLGESVIDEGVASLLVDIAGTVFTGFTHLD